MNHTLKAFLQVLFPRAESTCAYLEAVLVSRSPFLLPEAPQTQVTWFRSVSEGWSRPLESAHPGSELASRPLSSRASRGAMHFSLRCARPQAGAGAPEKGQRKEKARTARGGGLQWRSEMHWVPTSERPCQRRGVLAAPRPQC